MPPLYGFENHHGLMPQSCLEQFKVVKSFRFIIIPDEKYSSLAV